eukprot:TRINITY_DN17051_c0_g2_i1.p1 TRINITY_DN17051_c0_g2~~TRINITY_DN17051_c0_g2_i1.p1  ORF type:complete len:216 (+),score=28.20 TRINITY_DN17051_c0_g2_i1:76-648(+)
MTSVYGSQKKTEFDKSALLEIIPYEGVVKDTRVVVKWLEKEEAALAAFNEVIEEGTAWPFEDNFDMEGFESYFLSHAAFGVRDGETDELLSIFYIKPNFPGRCSHVCNGGFITLPKHRRKGLARLMGTLFIKWAPLLGFKSACFNLVFATNPSLSLWISLGFKVVGTLPAAARLRGSPELVDANVMSLVF